MIFYMKIEPVSAQISTIFQNSSIEVVIKPASIYKLAQNQVKPSPFCCLRACSKTCFLWCYMLTDLMSFKTLVILPSSLFYFPQCPCTSLCLVWDKTHDPCLYKSESRVLVRPVTVGSPILIHIDDSTII